MRRITFAPDRPASSTLFNAASHSPASRFALRARTRSTCFGSRAKRDAGLWEAALKSVEDAARSGANVMPRILNAVEANATVGEISDAMRRVFGEYKEAVVI